MGEDENDWIGAERLDDPGTALIQSLQVPEEQKYLPKNSRNNKT